MIFINTAIDEGFWSIFGAVVGAFLGALFGFFTLLFNERRTTSKLSDSLYKEAEFISSYMKDFFISVVSEYKRSKIFHEKGESFSGPSNIDFNTINTIFMELYKTNKIPSVEHRKFIHNIKYQWEMVNAYDIDRVKLIKTNAFYLVDRAKCLDIIYSLVTVLYYFDLFCTNKESFKFDESDFLLQANYIFNKLEIDGDKIINVINKQLTGMKGLS
ncbi:hypothetical protein [Vibrio quintilis]|uniref:Uncharacterized protein n=1 Tax=Vibrio quintilis TaxID=1117707 RepID=A0A1M7Z2J7_9VIBR|nr:hypothetical protein [Vibrio quintilis]SHO59123.1 hypothetical protein VQ7734_04900 [Vibrio quintilis]